MHGRRRGFTMVEMLGALAVLGALMAVAIPLGQAQLHQSRVSSADTTLRSLEREAAQLAPGQAPAAGASAAVAVPPAGMPDGAAVAALDANGTLPARLIWLDSARNVCRLLLLPTGGQGLLVDCYPDGEDAGDPVASLYDDGGALADDVLADGRWIVEQLGVPGAPSATFDEAAGTATLTWAAGAGVAESFRVWRRVASGEDVTGPWEPVATVPAGRWTSPRLDAGQTVQFAVSAVNAAAQTERSDPVTIAADTVVPAAPSAASARADGDVVTVSWSLASGDDRPLEVWRTNVDCTAPTEATCTRVQVASLDGGTRQVVDGTGDTPVPAGRWRYWVLAGDQPASHPATSTVVAVGGARPAAPTGLTHEGLQLRWDAAADADGLLVLRDGGELPDGASHLAGDDTTFAVADHDHDGATWTVVAVRDGRWSPPAGPVQR